ncbi:MAG: tripartite tricarboxylate transporter substrate binding protein [Betaproteobacteria bacterium]|nr:tripartite tricarboxylate transporter substrate binding protein [Betaproteobacteria bacterium]
MKRALLIGIALCISCAQAQDFPAKPLRMVIGYAAGGPTDVIGRIVAQDMAASLGQPVVVENRTGANGLIGTLEVKKAPADGYTFLVTTLSHNVNALLMADKKSYDPLADFTTISLLAFLPMVMVAGADSPFASVPDVIAAAKARPGEISYGSAGNGGSAHLAGALLATLTNTRMTHVPFRGNAPALTEVMAGRVSFMFYPMIGIAEQVREKRLKALAVTTEKRHPDYPGVPTTAESGLPGFEDYTQGLGVVGPAGISAPVVQKLNAAVRSSLAKPETGQRLKQLGALVHASSPEEFRAWLRQDAERWARVIKAAGVTAD